jgi:hypothetical protein
MPITDQLFKNSYNATEVVFCEKFLALNKYKEKRRDKSHVWQCIPITLALRRLRQKDHEFKVSLGLMVRSCQRNKKRKRKEGRKEGRNEGRKRE